MSETMESPAPGGHRSIALLAAMGLAAATALAPLALSPPAQAEVPSDDPQVQGILEQDERFSYLGTPVTSQIPSQAAHGIEDDRHVSYQLFKGTPESDTPATFAVTDVETGEQLFTCASEGSEHARNLDIATDGRVYWGSYYDSKLWRYDPGTQECEDLGPISDSGDNDHAFGVAPGPDGSMFLGVYPDTRLYQVDPETDEIELLQQDIAPTSSYIHGIAYDEASDSVYVGTGGQVPEIWRIDDGGRGEKTLVASEENAPGISDGATTVGRMDLVGDRIFAQIGLRLLVMDLDGNIVHWDAEQTRYYFGHHAIEGAAEGEVIFSTEGWDLLIYDTATDTVRSSGITIGGYLSNGIIDDSSGTPLLYGTSAVGVFVADLETGELLSENPIDFAQPTLIQKVLNGPDGSIWASGYMVGLAEVDKTGAEHGATLQRGQYESSVVRDGKLYLGAYGHAKLEVIDPATYDPADTATVTQLYESQHQGQDRPHGLDHNPDRDEIYMGAVALYGQTQGGLAIWDGATGEHVWLTEEIGADENIVSVASNETDGLVYLGSTVDGGLGSDPSGNTAGKLIVFDPETRTVAETMDPAGEEREGITGLMVDDDGLVWGVAEQSLFAYDPATGESEVRGSVGGQYAEGTTYWAYGNVSRSAADGRIYVTAGGRFSVHDPTTGETTQIATGVGWSTTDDAGDVFVSAGPHLFRYDVEGGGEPEPGRIDLIGAAEGEQLAAGSTKTVQVRVGDPGTEAVSAVLLDAEDQPFAELGEFSLRDGHGEVSFEVPDLVGEELALSVSAGDVASRVGFTVVDSYQAPQPPFVDVPFGMEHYEAMAWMKDTGVSTGWADGTYRPVESVNRDAMAAFLHRLAGEPEVELPESSPFSDVEVGDEHYEAIVWAAHSGITTGWSDGTFRPTEPIGRDAMAAFVHRYAGAPEFEAPAVSPFTDVATTDLFYMEMTWMRERGLATGWADGSYRPLQATNRDATAAFLFRLDHGQNIIWVPITG